MVLVLVLVMVSLVLVMVSLVLVMVSLVLVLVMVSLGLVLVLVLIRMLYKRMWECETLAGDRPTARPTSWEGCSF